MRKKVFRFSVFVILSILAMPSTLFAYSLVAIDKQCNSYEDGQLKYKISKGICKYEVNETLKTVIEGEGWVETAPDNVIQMNNKYSIIAIDNPVPVSDIEKIRQKVIHAVSVGTFQAGVLKNSRPTLLVIGENYFKRIHYSNGLIQISEGEIIKLTPEQAKQLSPQEFRQFQENRGK